MEAVAEHDLSVVLSSHLVADLERVCNYLIVLAMPLSIRLNLFTSHHTMTTTIGRDISFNSDPQGNFTLTTGSLPGQPGAWILSSGAVNAAGNPVGTAPACKQAVQSSESSGLDCLASHGIRIAVTYQPAGRYWASSGPRPRSTSP